MNKIVCFFRDIRDFVTALCALVWWCCTFTKEDELAALIEEYGEDEGTRRFNNHED